MAREAGDFRPVGELSVSGSAGWWNGSREPSIENVVAILRLTNGSADWLLLDRGPMLYREPSVRERALARIEEAIDDMRAKPARQRIRQRA